MEGRSLLAVVVAALLVSRAAAAADDATQSLESPLSPGSGVTLAASKQETALRIGLSSQFASNTALWWQLGLEGSVEDEDEKQLFSLSDGVSPGVSVKAGLGYSSFSGGLFTANCNVVMANKRKREQATHNRECLDKADELAQALSVSLPPRADGEPCRVRAAKLVQAVDRPVAGGAAPASAATGVALSASADRAFDALRQKVRSDRVARLARELTALLEPAAVDLKGGCAALAQDDDPVTRKEYDELVRPHESEGSFFKVALNAFGSLKQVEYRSEDDGVVDLADSQQALLGLPGASLDFVYYRQRLAAGLQLGYARSSSFDPVEVCQLTSQSTDTGEFQTRECARAALGKPETRSSLFLGAAVELEPLAEIGELLLGAELLARLTSAEAEGVSLFERDSWRTELTLPVFVASRDAPAGLRAGFAPQLGWPAAESEKTTFSVQMFVGTRFGAPGVPAE